MTMRSSLEYKFCIQVYMNNADYNFNSKEALMLPYKYNKKYQKLITQLAGAVE